MSLGMLIELPIERTPELLRDVGLAVLDIADGIRLLLCRVYNVCLKPEPHLTRPQVPCVTQKGSKELDLRNWLETWCRS
jgi:hypothetical protein